MFMDRYRHSGYTGRLAVPVQYHRYWPCNNLSRTHARAHAFTVVLLTLSFSRTTNFSFLPQSIFNSSLTFLYNSLFITHHTHTSSILLVYRVVYHCSAFNIVLRVCHSSYFSIPPFIQSLSNRHSFMLLNNSLFYIFSLFNYIHFSYFLLLLISVF